MVIKLDTGLKKKVEVISKTPSKEIKRERSEMTNTINEIKNT